MFNDVFEQPLRGGSYYPARKGSQEGATHLNMGAHNVIHQTYNVFSSNTTVTTKSPNRPTLPATPPPSLLYLRGTPQQQYRRLPLLANSPQRKDSLLLADENVVSPTVDNGRLPMHDSFLALTNRTDASGMQTICNFLLYYSLYLVSASKVASDLVLDLSEKFVLMGTTQRATPTSSFAEHQQRRDAVDLLVHLAKLGKSFVGLGSQLRLIRVPTF